MSNFKKLLEGAHFMVGIIFLSVKQKLGVFVINIFLSKHGKSHLSIDVNIS